MDFTIILPIFISLVAGIAGSIITRIVGSKYGLLLAAGYFFGFYLWNKVFL